MGTVYCCDCAKENADLKAEVEHLRDERQFFKDADREKGQCIADLRSRLKQAEVRLEHRERILGGYVEEKQAEIERPMGRRWRRAKISE